MIDSRGDSDRLDASRVPIPQKPFKRSLRAYDSIGPLRVRPTKARTVEWHTRDSRDIPLRIRLRALYSSRGQPKLRRVAQPNEKTRPSSKGLRVAVAAARYYQRCRCARSRPKKWPRALRAPQGCWRLRGLAYHFLKKASAASDTPYVLHRPSGGSRFHSEQFAASAPRCRPAQLRWARQNRWHSTAPLYFVGYSSGTLM